MKKTEHEYYNIYRNGDIGVKHKSLDQTVKIAELTGDVVARLELTYDNEANIIAAQVVWLGETK